MRRVARIGLLVFMSAVAASWQIDSATAQRGRSARDSSSETMTLPTKDGVRLKVSYYPSELGKDAVPVVMLHDYKENRAVFNGLAAALQGSAESGRPSHAVITVDLRGHGESTTQEAPNGQRRELDMSRFGKQDFQNMVRFDMEAVRKFLVKKNDAGELNLNSLCLLGSGMGANVATTWAAIDWRAPRLASRKQGQDVKGLILSSPEWSYHGLPILRPLKQPGLRDQVSVLVVYGEEDRKSKKSAENIYKNLERYHPEPPPELRREQKDLFLVGRPTSLKGTRLLADPDFGMLPIVEQFVDARLSQQDFEWMARRQSN